MIASWPCLLGLGAMTSKASVNDLPLESQHLKPLQEQRASSYQNQRALRYQSCTPQEAAFCSKPQRQLPPKNYATHSFLGIQNAWIGQKIIFDDSRPAWSGSQRQLEKKVFPTASFFAPSETLMKRTIASHSYPIKKFYPDAKAQGGLDHDFQKALQQKKSPAEVREMLEKGIN